MDGCVNEMIDIVLSTYSSVKNTKINDCINNDNNEYCNSNDTDYKHSGDTFEHSSPNETIIHDTIKH